MRSSTPCFTVAEQRLLLNGDLEGQDGLGRCLMRLSLSTGIHPIVWSRPQDYQVTITPEYYGWSRAKNKKPILNAWSPAMLDDGVRHRVYMVQGKSPQWLGQCAYEAEKAAGLPYREPFRIGRRTFFVNLARLGLDPWTISQSSGTSLDTIGRFYMLGAKERKRLGQVDLDWLEWLMGV